MHSEYQMGDADCFLWHTYAGMETAGHTHTDLIANHTTKAEHSHHDEYP